MAQICRAGGNPLWKRRLASQ
ncbi:hypothetical protein CBM2587_A170009 [Cupriavidus taiwanensis]|uniref:Uncharacterized protein n=1 Tax=Cupriavidus taiwanensis TaxID=164546 RepID=A0A375BMM3_9BURK|nr:hypothetical protein CBM2587_A170009 [Cupriavidus taiwanensis]